MTHLVSDRIFLGFVTVMIVATSIGWSTVEIVRLRRSMKMDRADPAVRDRIFGHYIGLIIAFLAAVGVIRQYLL